MKIRIQGNSVRIRLSRTEVNKLNEEGYIEESTFFGNSFLKYAVKQSNEDEELRSTYADNIITMHVPQIFLEDWPINDIVGFNSNMPVSTTETLYLLLEKDFKCIDKTTEDQSDNFENPNKTC